MTGWLRRRRPAGADEGISMIELLVSMGIMSIVGVVFTAGIIQIYRTSAATDTRAAAQGQLSQGLLRLERELRYASYIDATSASRPYVEYLLQVAGVQTCVQLRIAGAPAGSQLQRRSWTQGSTAADLTAWLPLATGITSTTPFTRILPTDALPHQQLVVTLTATSGSTVKQVATTYTALNTDSASVDTATSGTGTASAEPCYTTGTRS